MSRQPRPQVQRSNTSGSLHGEQLMRGHRSRHTHDEDSSTRQASPEHRRSQPATESSSPEGRPFACPFAKYDPVTYSHRNVSDHEYRNCSTGYWTSIARLKQHLYRTHDRSLRCCERCWQNFPNEDMYRRHVQARNCESRAEPEEKMDAEQHQAVKERVQGKPFESWYKIYRILFPEETEPPSPYAEWVTGQDLRNCFQMLQQRLPVILYQEAVARNPEARNRQATRTTAFPTTAETIQRVLQQCQREFGQRTGLSHVFLSGPPSPTGSNTGSDDNEGGAVPATMIRPNPDQRASYRHSTSALTAVRPAQLRQPAEEDSEDSEMDVDDRTTMPSRHSQPSHGARHGYSGAYYTSTSVAYTTAPSYTAGTAALSEEDMREAQVIQQELYRYPDHDWSR